MGQETTKKRKDQIVIGIDFGSCGITFAYGFLDDPTKTVYNGKFAIQGINDKVSTEIILDEELKEVLCFGNECSNYLNSIGNKKYYHFKNIKMNLYTKESEKKKGKKDYTIKANNSNIKVNIEYIITLILKKVKEIALKQIKDNYKNFNLKNIHWTITVPAIWEIKSKQIMINAAQNAKMIRSDDDPSNFFALEPEAASIYYHYSHQGIKNEEIDTGKPFILCDLGSGTADIVTQKKDVVNNTIKFEELHKPVGGDCGCNKINEQFIDRVIIELFGKDCFDKTKENICREHYNDWFEFEGKIEDFKKKFIDYKQLNDFYKVDCEIFKEFCKEELNALIEKFNSKNPDWKLKSKGSWKVLFPYKIINDLMFELIHKIKNDYLLKIIQAQSKSKNKEKIKTLVFTGGASSSPILFSMLKNLDDLGIKDFIKAENPEVAIANGSVLYSYDHFIISPRKAKFTFGIKSSDIWDEKKHKNGGIKVYDPLDKIWRCKNSFTKFITEGANLRPDDEISHRFILNNSQANVELFKTSKKDATFTDEEGVEKFGEFIINVENKFDESDKEVEVKMKLGGTFISASAIYCKTKDKFKITCLYE